MMDQEIGRGFFGVVYQGRWRAGVVAIKQLANELNSAQMKDFKAEAELMASLRPHTNVIQFLGIATKPGKPPCIVTEFMMGGNLYDHLQNHPLKEEEQVKIAQGVAAGMLHLTSEGIVHRDLAARNVLLSGISIPKIADFGMSQFGESTASVSDIVGPIRSMAPESLLNRMFNEKTDVWAFGCLIYEIITCKMPYPNMEQIEVARLVTAGELKPKTGKKSAPVLSKLMNDCTEFDPEKRPTFKQIYDELRA